MADLTLPTRVKVSELDFETWAPGQSASVAQYASREYVTGDSAFGFRGSVVLASSVRAAGGDQGLADNALASFARRLRGRRNRVKLPLPTWARPSTPPPSAAAATVTGAVVDGESVVLTLAKTGFGTWDLQADDWINVGDRLYGIDSVSGSRVTCTPGVLPLAVKRQVGFQSLAPAPAGTFPYGLGAFNGRLWVASFNAADRNYSYYWVDPYSGAYRRVVRGVASSTGFGEYNGRLWAFGRHSGYEAVFSLVTVRLGRIEDNGIANQFGSSTTGAAQPTGMAECTLIGDAGPHLYVSTSNKLWRAKRPILDAGLGVTWADYFDEVVGPTGFSGIHGLSPSPDGRKLWVLDASRNVIDTWDGRVQSNVVSGYAGGSTAGVQCSGFRSIEWFKGELLLGHDHPTAGLYRLNLDVPSSAPRVELAEPYVMARLSPSRLRTSSVGAGRVSFQWTEVPE